LLPRPGHGEVSRCLLRALSGDACLTGMPTTFNQHSIPAELRAQWGLNLQAARKRAGFPTQKAFAEAVGCTRQAVTQWENGRTAPGYAARQRIAEVLGKKVAQLFPNAA
jgi:DNA-binding XRE family transcriptional regulator